MKKLLVGLLVLGSFSVLSQEMTEITPPRVDLASSTVAVEIARSQESSTYFSTSEQAEYISSVKAYELNDGSIKLVAPYRHTAVGEANILWSQRKKVCESFGFQETLSSEKGTVETKVHRENRRYESISIKTKKKKVIAEITCK